MLFNWVQPLFNRYAQRCAKGVTRVPNQAHLGTCIHQYIRNHLFLSTPYSQFQVQLPFIAMWSMNNSRGMQV